MYDVVSTHRDACDLEQDFHDPHHILDYDAHFLKSDFRSGRSNGICLRDL